MKATRKAQATRKAAQLRKAYGLGMATLAALAFTGPVRADTVVNENDTGSAGPSGDFFSYGGDGYTVGGGTYTFTGGSYTGGDGGIAALESSGGNGLSVGGGTVTITGGAFTGGKGGSAPGSYGGNGLIVDGTTVSIYGGTIAAGTPGGSSTDLNALYGATITLYGTDLMFNTGDPLTVSGNATTDSTHFGSGTITGTLLDNASSSSLSYVNAGTITLVNLPAAVPEPSTIAPFALGVLGLLGLTLRARRRSKSA